MRVIGASSGLGLMMLLTAALAAWPDFDTQACSLLQDANGAAKSLAGHCRYPGTERSQRQELGAIFLTPRTPDFIL